MIYHFLGREYERICTNCVDFYEIAAYTTFISDIEMGDQGETICHAGIDKLEK